MHAAPLATALQQIDLDDNGQLDLRYALADGETMEVLFSLRLKK